MKRLLPAVLLATCLLLTATFGAAADVKPEVVRKVKRATALVVQPRGFATAFCIDPAGYYLTNDADNDGASSDDFTYTYPKFHEIADYLHEKNTYIFFGDGGTFQKVKLTIDQK